MSDFSFVLSFHVLSAEDFAHFKQLASVRRRISESLLQVVRHDFFVSYAHGNRLFSRNETLDCFDSETGGKQSVSQRRRASSLNVTESHRP